MSRRPNRESIGWMMQAKERQENERLKLRVKRLEETLQYLMSHGYCDGMPYEFVEAAILDLPLPPEQARLI